MLQSMNSKSKYSAFEVNEGYGSFGLKDFTFSSGIVTQIKIYHIVQGYLISAIRDSFEKCSSQFPAEITELTGDPKDNSLAWFRKILNSGVEGGYSPQDHLQKVNLQKNKNGKLLELILEDICNSNILLSGTAEIEGISNTECQGNVFFGFIQLKNSQGEIFNIIPTTPEICSTGFSKVIKGAVISDFLKSFNLIDTNLTFNTPIVEVGKVAFEHYYNNEYMWSGKGKRDLILPVKFQKKFKRIPLIQIGFWLVDTSCGQNTRVEANYQNVNLEGFEIKMTTCEDSKTARLGVNWMAIE